MDLSDASSKKAVRTTQLHPADTRLHGRWLVLAWAAWALLSSGTLLAFAFRLPVYLTLLQTVCTGTGCLPGQPAPDTEATLHRLGLSLGSYVTFNLVLTLASMLLACTMSSLLAWRKPRDWLALLVALMLIMFGTANSISASELSHSAWHFPAMLFTILHFATIFLVGSLIPTGRFVPRWTHWLVPAWLLWRLILLFFPTLPSADLLNTLIWLSGLACISVAMIYRYQRMSSPIQRQQLKWIVFGGSATILIVIVFNLPPLIFPALSRTGSLYDLFLATINTLVLVPAIFCFAIAILRYRLWEIDVIINRTLVYGTLTGILALVYVGLVIGLQALLRGIISQESSVAIVVSTLAIAALFQPFRHRTQQIIDRRFYRRTYDAAQTLAAFGARLQQPDEVDLTKLSADLLAVVHQTMQPTHVSLWLRQPPPQAEPLRVALAGAAPEWQTESSSVVIASNDPLVAYLLGVAGAVSIEQLHLDSPALHALQEASVKLAVPLLSQGELVGLLQLGPHKSDQGYSSDDRRLLHTLAIQAAPAIRVAQLVREQQAQARERERLEQELRIAQQIQQAFLPKDLPELAGWQVATYYQPARAVGGDFYDFLAFADGRLAIVIGDVSGKGIPAALLMTTTRTILRSVAQREASPGQVLEQTNAILCPEMPPGMFVTCLYAILDPASGRLRYANAGHDQPYQRQYDRVSELWATGMPLGLMPGMTYEEKETSIAEGDSVLWYSDGLVEAHNPEQAMFGFPRLAKLLEEQRDAPSLIEVLLQDLTAFTGPAWEQEDDVTLLTLQRSCHLT
jgi:serine phosphatase RsbU (regulator of sigma subunit)